MTRALLRNPVTIGIIALVVLILLVSTFFIVPETQQVVVLRFEQPVRTINAWKSHERFGDTGAGLQVRIPFVDRLVWVDKRILDVDYVNQQVLSSDQRLLQVDAYARFRVVDPLKMVTTAGGEAGVTDALRPLLGTAIRNELGKHAFATLLTPERDQLMANIRAGLQQLAQQYGVAIVDVRIKHADLPDGSPLNSALQSMASARQQQATTIRAEGNKQAQIIRADAEAQAAQIYADAFNQDPKFYDFYRAMQSYQHTFGADGDTSTPHGTTQVILSPDNAYLKQFEGK